MFKVGQRVKIYDPVGRFHEKVGRVIGRQTLINTHFNWKREMVFVTFQPYDQKWIAFPKEAIEETNAPLSFVGPKPTPWTNRPDGLKYYGD